VLSGVWTDLLLPGALLEGALVGLVTAYYTAMWSWTRIRGHDEPRRRERGLRVDEAGRGWATVVGAVLSRVGTLLVLGLGTVAFLAAFWGPLEPYIGPYVLPAVLLLVGGVPTYLGIVDRQGRRADQDRFGIDAGSADGRLVLDVIAELGDVVASFDEATPWSAHTARLDRSVFESAVGQAGEPAAMVRLDGREVRFAPEAKAYVFGWDRALRRLRITPARGERTELGYRYITAYVLGLGFLDEVLRTVPRELSQEERERFAKAWALWSIAVHLKRRHPDLEPFGREDVVAVLVEETADHLAPGLRPYTRTELTGLLERADADIADARAARGSATRWIRLVAIGVALGIPSIALGIASPLPAVAAFVTFALWGAFDIFEQNGWSRRVVAPAIALIWAVDLWIDLGLLLAVTGFGAWVEAAFVVADLAFLVATWPAALRAWRDGEQPHASEGWVLRWVAFPAVTVATGLHTIELVMAASWAAGPMGVVAVTLAVLTVVEHLRARREGAGGRGRRVTQYVEGAALLGYGLLRAVLEQMWALAAVTGGVAIAFTALLWVLQRARTSGGAGTDGDGGLLADGLAAKFEKQAHGVLIRQTRRHRVARRVAEVLRIRGPPLEVGADERLWVVPRARLARWLRRDGMDRQFADLVAGRVWAAGVLDGRGHRVYVVVAERVPALRASGVWSEVRDHEVRHFAEAGWEAGDHSEKSKQLIAEIKAEVTAAGGAGAGEVPGWRARLLPWSWRGGARLREVFGPVREASAGVERARTGVLAVRRAMRRTARADESRSRLLRWWLQRRVAADLRGARDLPGLLEERGRALFEAQQAERAATSEAMAGAVLAGFGRRAALQAWEVAVLGWKRHVASLAAPPFALPGEAAGTTTTASMELAEYYDRPASWVAAQGFIGTATTASIGLAMAGLGDRLIKNMVALVVLGVVGSAAALYPFDKWEPWFAGPKRREARAKRRQSIGLPDPLVERLLVPALEKLIAGNAPPGNVSRAQARGQAGDDHPPTADGDLDDRRPRLLLQALNLDRTARAAVRRPVLDLRNKGPPPDPPTGGGAS
jgi:hypothetical protein